MPTTRKSSTRRPAAKRYPTGRYVVIQVKAPNTPSGNPRRLYVATHVKSGNVFAFDEGYQGKGALPGVVQTGMDFIAIAVAVSASEYNRLRKAFPA